MIQANEGVGGGGEANENEYTHDPRDFVTNVWRLWHADQMNAAQAGLWGGFGGCCERRGILYMACIFTHQAVEFHHLNTMQSRSRT